MVITKKMISALRPCSKKGLSPINIKKIIGKKTRRNMKMGEEFNWQNLI